MGVLSAGGRYEEIFSCGGGDVDIMITLCVIKMDIINTFSYICSHKDLRRFKFSL